MMVAADELLLSLRRRRLRLGLWHQKRVRERQTMDRMALRPVLGQGPLEVLEQGV